MVCLQGSGSLNLNGNSFAQPPQTMPSLNGSMQLGSPPPAGGGGLSLQVGFNNHKVGFDKGTRPPRDSGDGFRSGAPLCLAEQHARQMVEGLDSHQVISLCMWSSFNSHLSVHRLTLRQNFTCCSTSRHLIFFWAVGVS